MDMLLSAVLGEAITRSINFFISKSSKQQAKDVEGRLMRVLLRAQVIVDEAMRWDITNQAMHKQLEMLRDSMFRGYYMLDSFRCQYKDKEEPKDQILSQYSLFSKPTSAEHFCFPSGTSTDISKELQEVLDSLSSMIIDANELVIFFKSYPRLYRQPYSLHILLSNCLFGRQLEAQLIINFLLRTATHCAEELEIMPIVGPGKVGKSTLVAHVCKDERVCDHFSEILLLQECAVKHRNQVSDSNKDGRLLVIVELIGDLNESAWNSFYFVCKQFLPTGSKIIITSRSENIVRYLPQEAYWYFFKALTFGSMDTKVHPKHVHLAMEIAKTLSGSFHSANATACFLREHFDIRFWFKVLAFLRAFIQRHISRLGGHPSDILNRNRPVCLQRMGGPAEDFVIYGGRECLSQEEVPKIKQHDVTLGGVKPHGKFDVLVWRSQIPPYYSYVNTCEILELKTIGAKRKRCMKNGV
ncbi:hypothetical protein HU200_027859 [Digitaria exilis]|uniref:Rx N-terminal domain-containing protein n=1 Tax=Digitaria exilis TaxID=1010633 RepID=A0A835ESY3_9POAL|nr:hypothetical protein HU200_027859 [Digitaria exilis]